MMLWALTAAAAAKLVIVAPGQAAAVTDYASLQRCERAAESLRRQQREAVEAARQQSKTVNSTGPFDDLIPGNSRRGFIYITPPTVAQVYCIPG